MNYKDTLKFTRLKETFSDNFRLTHLYTDYLQTFPEIITKETIDEICKCGVTPKEALVAILSQLFSLDFDNPDDRRIIMEYITPSVRIMDAKKYTENPYYKRVKIQNVSDGNWELRQESYKPYRGVIVSDMRTFEDMKEYPELGFFTEEFFFPAVLEDGNEWMTLTPVDLDTCDEAIEIAKGKVVTFGLGLGYYAFMVSEKEDVDSITVIEKSPDVIKLFERYILPYFSHRDKVKVICADAFEYAEKVMPKESFDVAFVDTWRDAGDGAPMYEKMKALECLSPNTRFLYWIENFLISRLRSIKFSQICEKVDKGEITEYEKIIEMLNDIS